MSDHLQRVVDAIRRASAGGPTALSRPDVLSGYSGRKVVGLLQRLPQLFRDEDAAYLEVGVFRGLTLLSVASANAATPCYGIDNFTFFDREGTNRAIVAERMKELGVTNATVVDADYEDALASLARTLGTRKVGVYFVDGPHDYRSQLMCLLLVQPYLHANAVVVVDDSNYSHVRQANRDFLRTHSDFRLLFEAYTESHPGTMTGFSLDHVREGWWNGINVLVRTADEGLAYQEPPTDRDRTRFVNDHLVHAARLAELAPECTWAVEALLSGRVLQASLRLVRLWRRRRGMKDDLSGRDRANNTYSASISGERWNHGVPRVGHAENGWP